MKCIGTIIAICGLSVAFFNVATHSCLATTWYVSTSGSDSNSGSSSSPFATLYKAVTVVDAGDTVDINSGTYVLDDEAPSNGYPVNVTRSGTSSAPITIQSTPGQTAIIDGNGLWEPSYDAVDINANYIVFQNLTVEYGGANDLTIENGDYDTVTNCTFEYGVWGGANIGDDTTTSELSNDVIESCTIYDNSTVNVNGGGSNWGGGLGMNNCTNCTLAYNTVDHNWGEGLTDGSWNGAESSGNIVEDNTIWDNWSVELYLNCAQYCYVYNNFVYADSSAPLRGSYPAIGLAVDNEATTYLGEDCDIFNNIVIGGMQAFRYANTNTYSGFYNGGLNGFKIYNNIFYGGNLASVSIDDDSGNNFTWENNITWQTNNSTTIASDGGGGTQTLVTNCWDGQGSNNMNKTGDVILSNTNPDFADAGGDSPSDWVLSSSSPCYTSGTNAYSLFTFDFNWTTRPSSGSWTMGPFAATSGYSGYYRLVCLNGGFALSTNNSTTSGTDVIQDTSEVGWWDQEWSVVQDTDGYYRFVNRNSGMALDCNGSTSSGTDMVQKTSSSGDHDQEFQIVSEGSGYYNLVNYYSSMAVNTNNSTTAGTDVIQYTNETGWWDEEFEFVSD